jgi:hypothetical protein
MAFTPAILVGLEEKTIVGISKSQQHAECLRIAALLQSCP